MPGPRCQSAREGEAPCPLAEGFGNRCWSSLVFSPGGSQKKKSSEKIGRHPMEACLGSPTASLKSNEARETFQHQHKRVFYSPHQNYH